MIKNVIKFIFITATLINAQSNNTNHWETIVYNTDTWSYFVGDSEPPADWKQIIFDDAQWQVGPGGIGYGDNDDNTEISSTISLYKRIKFNITDTTLLTKALLSVDYDDAFVAYLNGVEIARVGISGENPTFDQIADINHDANIPSGGIPDAFSIDSKKLDSCLTLGENVLSLQIHNASATSTDLSSTTFLSVGISNTTSLFRETPNWFVPPFEFYSSDIPIVIIDTEGGTILHEPKIPARMGIINNGSGNRNTVSDSLNEYEGWVGIEYRGNASFRHFDKKPLTIETRNEDGSNNNVKLLGLPKENDFVLHSIQMDKTLLRDALAYNIYRNMGRWAPRTRHVNLILNGDYLGVYLLLEKIKPDKNRLDIAKMDSDDISGDSLTGGYIWCTNRRWGDEEHNDLILDTNEVDGNQRFLRYPKPSDAVSEQVTYIRDLEQEFCDVMYTSLYNYPGIGYDKYINLDSFIDEMIMQEFTSNSDGYGYSGYFHKDRGGKINAGPLWDFDQGLCNSSYNDGARYDEWIVEKGGSSHPPFWRKLFDDPEVKDSLKKRWNELRQNVITNEKIFSYIDSVANYLNEAKDQNFSRWPILGTYIWRSLPGADQRDTYQKEVNYMKDWLTNHLQWMDTQLTITTSILDDNNEILNEFKLDPNYPNPFNPSTLINYQIPQMGKVTISIYSTLGNKIKTLVRGEKSPGRYSVIWDGSNNSNQKVASGIYYYKLIFSNKSNYWQNTRKMILLK